MPITYLCQCFVKLKKIIYYLINYITLNSNTTMHSYYQLNAKIADGSFGEVFKLKTSKQTDPETQIKPTLALKASKQINFPAEYDIMTRLQCDNIQSIHKILSADELEELGVKNHCGGFAMELAEESLADMLVRKVITNKQAYYLAYQLCNAVVKLHSAGYYHLDIKPGNCLIYSGMKLRLTDFGMSAHKSCRYLNDTVITHCFRPPEVKERGRYAISEFTDIYSVGATLYHIFIDYTYYPPNEDESEDNYCKRMMKRYREGYLNNTSLPDKLRMLLSETVSYIPNARPHLQFIMNEIRLSMGSKYIEVLQEIIDEKVFYHSDYSHFTECKHNRYIFSFMKMIYILFLRDKPVRSLFHAYDFWLRLNVSPSEKYGDELASAFASILMSETSHGFGSDYEDKMFDFLYSLGVDENFKTRVFNFIKAIETSEAHIQIFNQPIPYDVWGATISDLNWDTVMELYVKVNNEILFYKKSYGDMIGENFYEAIEYDQRTIMDFIDCPIFKHQPRVKAYENVNIANWVDDDIDNEFVFKSMKTVANLCLKHKNYVYENKTYKNAIDYLQCLFHNMSDEDYVDNYVYLFGDIFN